MRCESAGEMKIQWESAKISSNSTHGIYCVQVVTVGIFWGSPIEPEVRLLIDQLKIDIRRQQKCKYNLIEIVLGLRFWKFVF